MLAVVAAVHLFSDKFPKSRRFTADITLQAGTDNKALEALSFKQSSTKIPLVFVMMQLALLTSSFHVRLQLHWRLREHNTEADALTNLEFTGFCPEKCQHITWEALPLELLHQLVAQSHNFQAEIEANRKLGTHVHTGKASGTKRKRRDHVKTFWG